MVSAKPSCGSPESLSRLSSMGKISNLRSRNSTTPSLLHIAHVSLCCRSCICKMTRSMLTSSSLCRANSGLQNVNRSVQAHMFNHTLSSVLLEFLADAEEKLGSITGFSSRSSHLLRMVRIGRRLSVVSRSMNVAIIIGFAVVFLSI